MSYEEFPAEHVDDAQWGDRARTIIPGGTSTGSKSPVSLFGEGDDDHPTHYVSASGCTLVTSDGHDLIDCTMALGSVALGYGDETVTTQVMEAVAGGMVSGLPPILEVELAERLCEIVPCAEQVRFMKSGAEAVSAAVRVARTYTGRSHVVASGYFGWHDWSNDSAGIPENVRRDVTMVPFDDIGALQRAVNDAGKSLAAIVIEPVVNREPSREWLEAARKLASDHGAVLVFDEIKTGFRMRPGGYQEVCGIEPDLATYGKALANGFPLSVLAGRADVMEAATRTWISSTLACEAASLAAASAVLDVHEKNDVCDKLASAGAEMFEAVRAAVQASGQQGVTVEGLPVMWQMRWEDPALESMFLRLAAANGVLFKRGAYNFVSLAHDEKIITQVERAASTALVELREQQDSF